MEKKDQGKGIESRSLRIWNYFVPRDAKVGNIFGYACIDGTFLGLSSISVSFLIHQDIKAAGIVAVGLPFILAAHRIVRGPTNVMGEPWE